jgi:pyruvate-ferredoxin/flavodoxin oxidoreductase
MDSKEPTMSFAEYAGNQNRFRVLKKANPNEADALMEASAKDVATRYDLYRKLAELQADCGK